MGVVYDKKKFGIGIVLGVAFLASVAWMCTAPYGGYDNWLYWANHVFISVSKDTANYIPQAESSAKKMSGHSIDVVINLEDPEVAEKVKRLYAPIAEVEQSGGELRISGDLGKILMAAVADSKLLYENKGRELMDKYGFTQEKEVGYYWWISLSALQKQLMLQGLFDEAKAVKTVITRAVEVGYNFYGIEPIPARGMVATLTGLLVFYIFYTLWWGFAIQWVLEGFGLLVKKPKEKFEYGAGGRA